MKAALIEIFASIQGEGRFVGRPMTFVRVATCPLRCVYCDTPHSYEGGATFPVEGRGEVRNPVSASHAAELAAAVAKAGPYASRTVTLTGGEPLVYPEFVLGLGEILRGEGLCLHLETAAHDAVVLERCVGMVDHLSADLKLPETLSASGGRPTRVTEQNLQCVRIALRAGKTVDLKVVLTSAVTTESLAAALGGLEPAPALDLVLQPVTPFGMVQESVGPERIVAFCEVARALGFEPRVVPQIHPLLGVR